MSFIILRSGRRWRKPFMTFMVDVFHVVARQHNSRAVWVPSMQMVVTDDSAEVNKDLPYEEFIRMAAYRAIDKFSGQ